MKLRLIAALLALVAGSAACYDLATAPALEPGGTRVLPTSQADTTERGGTTMGSGD